MKLTIKLAGPITVYPAPDGGGNPDGTGEYWEGWPAKIPNKYALLLFNEILKAENLVRWCIKNRWVLNRKKPGPRVLELEYGRKIEFRPGQTLTHYYARRCIRSVQAGKLAAMAGNPDKARMHWANAEMETERLYGSWLHTLAAKEAARVRGVKRFGEGAGSDTREMVKRVLYSLSEAERYERGVTSLVCERTGLSATQAREHIKALGYGAKNKKHGA